MVDPWRDFWLRGTGTGQQVAQLHGRYMMMMIKIWTNVSTDIYYNHNITNWEASSGLQLFCTIWIKIQQDATVCRYLFTAKLLYMFRVSQHPSSGVLKTLIPASGTGHNIGKATPLQRGLFFASRLAQTSPDQTTLEGSSCTDIMNCTGGCGYSF